MTRTRHRTAFRKCRRLRTCATGDKVFIGQLEFDSLVQKRVETADIWARLFVDRDLTRNRQDVGCNRDGVQKTEWLVQSTEGVRA